MSGGSAREALTENVRAALACPWDGGELEATDTFRCTTCGEQYPFSASGAPDLRLRRPRRAGVEIEVGRARPELDADSLAPLSASEEPEVDLASFSPRHHLSRDLFSHFPRASSPKALALDLGCGSGLHRSACQQAGFEYLGLDYEGEGADVLGDAHALPLRDASVDFILTLAVLEHLQYPLLAMREAARVLCPGGRLVGTVAFLEPFHARSFYHHSHLGVWSSLASAGFAVERIGPSRSWTVLTAQAQNALFPGLPGWMSRLLVGPVQWAHRAAWGIARRRHPTLSEAHRLRKTAGSFAFVATRPPEDGSADE